MPFLADRQWMRRRFEPDHSALREFLYPDARHEVISAVARKLHYFSLGVLHFFLPTFFVHLFSLDIHKFNRTRANAAGYKTALWVLTVEAPFSLDIRPAMPHPGTVAVY